MSVVTLSPSSPLMLDTALSPTAKLNQPKDLDADSIKKIAADFESIFLEIVLKSMRDTVPKSELIDGGNGEQIFQSMLDNEYAKSLANQGNTGIGGAVEKHLLGLMSPNAGQEEVLKRIGRAQYERLRASR